MAFFAGAEIIRPLLPLFSHNCPHLVFTAFKHFVYLEFDFYVRLFSAFNHFVRVLTEIAYENVFGFVTHRTARFSRKA